MWRPDPFTRALRRLFAVRHRPDPDHTHALEARLLSRFDAAHPEERSAMTKLRRLTVTAASVAVLALVASQAPASVSVELGRRITISPLPEGVTAKEIAESVRTLEETLHPREMKIAIRKHDSDLVLDVWSDVLPQSLADHVRGQVPALGGIAIGEEPLTATADVTLGKALRHRILDADLDAKDVETARQELLRRIQAEEPGAEVDVTIEEPAPGERKVEVKVRKTVEK